MSVPWSKIANGAGSASAPGPPDMCVDNGVRNKRKDKLPKKLEKKLKDLDSTTSSDTSDSDGKSTNQEWNPMKEDFTSPTFNSYSKGPGALLKPYGSQPSSNYTLFVDRIPIAVTRDGLHNLFSRCGKVKRAVIMKNQNPVTTFGFIEYGTLREADTALRQLNNFDMGKGIKLRVQVSEKHIDKAKRGSIEKENYQFPAGNKRNRSAGEEDYEGYEMNLENTTQWSKNLPLDSRSEVTTKQQTVVSPPKDREFSIWSNCTSPGKSFNSGSLSKSLTQSLVPFSSLQYKETVDSDCKSVSPNRSLPARLNSSMNNSNQENQLMTPNDFASATSKDPNDPTSTLDGSFSFQGQVEGVARSLCNYCGEPSSKKCAVCRTPYCGADCQSKDWSNHKAQCKRLAKELNDVLFSSSATISSHSKNAEKSDTQEDSYQELNELCGFMKHINIEPSTLMASNTLTPPDSPPISMETCSAATIPLSVNSVLKTVADVDSTSSLHYEEEPSIGLFKKSKRLNVSYSDLNAAFGLVPPLINLPVVDAAARVFPDCFYGYVCLVVSSCRVSVFPLHKKSKTLILKFLEFEENMLDTVKPVAVLPNNKQLFGYKCGNNTFQRVEVNSSTMLVCSYDTGEKLGTLEQSQLFVLPNELFSAPELRIKVSFNNTDPPSSKQAVSQGRNFLVQQILGKVIKVKQPVALDHFTTSFILGTLISIDDSVNFSELVTNSGHAFSRKSGTSSHPVAPSTPPKAQQKTFGPHTSKVSVHIPPKNKPFDIYPTVVTSPGIIWAQVFHEHSCNLEKLLEDMNTLYHNADNSGYVPAIGELCAAQFSFDGLYYRAEVIRINNNGLIDVQFVDYGNKETISFKDLHHLEPRFLSLPKQALCFYLHGVSPCGSGGAWSSQATAYVKQTILQQQVTVKIIKEIGGKYSTLINHPDCQGMLINDEIVKKGFAEKAMEMRGISSSRPSVYPIIGRGSAFNHPIKSPGAGDTVKNVYIGSQNMSTSACFSPATSPASSGGSLLETFTTSQQNRVHENHLIDSKRNENTSSSFGKCLTASSNDQMEGKRNKFEPKKEHATADAVSQNAKKPVFISTMAFPVDSKIKVVVIYVDSPHNFSVVTVGGVQQLVKLSKIIQGIEHQQVSGDVNIGDFYLAKSSVDNSFARAEVLKLKPNKALLRFVDHGNKQAVLIKDLVQIPYKVCTLPQQAISCSLSGVPAPEGKWPQPAVDYLTRLVLNKGVEVEVVRIMEGNVHEVNISLHDSTVNIANALAHDEYYSSPVPQSIAVDVTSQPVCFPSCDILERPVLENQSAVVLADITDVNEFYVHPCNQDTSIHIKKILIAPSEFNQQSISSPLHKGYLCCARFANDGQWYRACVVSTDEEKGVYNVQFIDFGNYAEVSKENISLCPEELSRIPILAVRCALHNVSQSSPRIIEAFKSLAINKVLIASVVKDPTGGSNTWTISLVDTSGPSDVDIATCIKSAGVPQLEESVPDVDNPQPVFAPVPSFQPVTVPPPEIMKPGDRMQTLVTHITDPSKFYVEFLTSSCLQSFVQELCAELPAAYSDPSIYAGFKASVGGFCCAKFSQDDCWYRCKVLSISDDGFANLFYIDYGNTDRVSVDNIYHLDPKFASVPAQAVLCRLAGVCPAKGTQWSHTSVEYLKSVGGSNPLFAVIDSVDDDTLVIDLYMGKDYSQSIASALIENGLALSSKIEIYSIKPFELPKSNNAVDVVVSDVSSLLSLYIQVALPEVQRTLAGLQSTLGTYAKSSPCPASTYQPKVGDFCAAVFSDDNCWYRALVTGISGKDISVVYIDFGNSSIVHMSEIRLLTEELASYPQVACQVSLSSLASAPPSLLPLFRSLTDGKILSMKVINDKCKPVEVELYDSENPLSINHQLSSAVASFDPVKPVPAADPLLTVDPPHVPSQAEFNCMVVHVESLKKFYLQVTDADNVHNLMKLTKTINTSSQNAPPISTPLQDGQLCLAQFSGDYYRGKIVETSGNHSRVHFFDFGNTDVVHCSCIKMIPPQLLSLPAQALACSLAGISQDSVSDSNAIQLFTSLVGNIEVKCQVICKHPLIVDLQKGGEVSVSQTLGIHGLIPREVTGGCPFSLEEVNISNSNDKIVIMVTEVEKPNVLWMQVYDVDVLTDFEMVTVEMHQYCATTVQMKAPLLGQLCCAKFNADGSWYRGRVVDFSEKDEALVRFVDFGNVQSTPVPSLRDIQQVSLRLPAQGVPCLLNGYVEGDFSNLSNLLLNKQFNCVKQGVSTGGYALVDLFDIATGDLVKFI